MGANQLSSEAGDTKDSVMNAEKHSNNKKTTIANTGIFGKMRCGACVCVCVLTAASLARKGYDLRSA